MVVVIIWFVKIVNMSFVEFVKENILMTIMLNGIIVGDVQIPCLKIRMIPNGKFA